VAVRSAILVIDLSAIMATDVISLSVRTIVLAIVQYWVKNNVRRLAESCEPYHLVGSRAKERMIGFCVSPRTLPQ